jgi:hypothetical protein
MNEAAYYREEAARARRWAMHVSDREYQLQLLAIAESYDELAAKSDSSEQQEAPT